jgi:hypothetical protein
MRILSAIALATTLGCVQSDVGAPCNHGGISAPQEPVITFPALACDELLCVYGESAEPPAEPCRSHADCNTDGLDRFICNEGTCELAIGHVLTRSMCSRECSADTDCSGGAEDTACRTGFTCAPIQSLGDFCCESVCVCKDDLSPTMVEDLRNECASGDARGCCDRNPRPAACGG